MNSQLDARRAIESMRSGVPSAPAVRSLGSGQEPLDARFSELLNASVVNTAEGKQVRGLMFRAGFGEGKSHLLTCFEHNALDCGFAVSRVVISKETPLQVPGKLLAAAVESLRVPNRVGRGLEEVGASLQQRFESLEFRELAQYLAREDGLNSRFAATLHLYEKEAARNEELGDRILRFWSGDKLNVADLKRDLRELGDAVGFRLEPVRARELALQTMTFLPRLIRAAGFKGLVLLIDEVELIGRYTRLGRAQSYAELARWMGAIPEDSRPGLITVAAVTSDYDRGVLLEKQDLDQIPAFMAGRDPGLAEASEEGMRLIQVASLLEQPSRGLLDKTYSQLKSLHGDAYRWTPPDVTWPEAGAATPMRKYVRAWISAWDVRRLYPDQRLDRDGYIFDTIETGYTEEPDLEPDGSDETA